MPKELVARVAETPSHILHQAAPPLNGEKLAVLDTAMANPILSIMILTRNRRLELLKALQSCMECSLPPNTEFVIVDNASEDGTREAVETFFRENVHDYGYYYLPENIGCAAGRNEGLRRAKGRYVFFLDDDAYIESPKQDFFDRMISVLVQNKDVFCITTAIFDTELNGNRPCNVARKHYSNVFNRVLRFHGGSCLVDKERLFDRNQLFFDYQFRGMAELYPSLKSYFEGKSVIEMESVRIIHDPSPRTRLGRRLEIIYHYTGSVHVRLRFYPLIAFPVVYAMFCVRIVRHLGFGALAEALAKLTEINRNLVREAVPFGRFIELVREFGFIAIF